MGERSDQQSCMVKRIKFFGRKVSIVMQNENGPCPLLAIANVLSLRNELKLPSGLREITQGELITLIVDLLLERSKHFEAAYAADYQQNISEIFPVLQKLTTGVDVNVKFHNLHAFEPTPEVAVFDLLGIPLVHGWLVDPQDAKTTAVFGNKSYNELVELLFLVLGDAEMEALSTGPLRNLSITSHHMHSFSHTGSPSAVQRTPSNIHTGPNSRSHSFAATTAQTAELQKALQGLSIQQQQEKAPGDASRPSAAGTADSNRQDHGQQPLSQQQEQGAAVAVAPRQQQQQPAQQPPINLSGSSSGTASTGPAQQQQQQQQQQQPDDVAIEAIMEEIMDEVCCTAMPSSIELGDSPTHSVIQTRRMAYEGAGPSRLNPNGTGAVDTPQAAAAAAAAATAVTGSSPNGSCQQASAASGLGTQPGQQQQQQHVDVAVNATAADAAVVRAFMEAHCSQLTPYGLSCMTDGLKEHQLAVFFRNNHFNALFKYEGSIYLLVTDQGYGYEPDIVWERLDSVQGDTTFCTSEFTPFVHHRVAEAAAGGVPTYTQVVAGGAAAAAAGDNIAALTDLDAAIAASLAAGDEHSIPSEPAGGMALHADADYALALQLQLQEEEAAAAARAAQQQQQGQGQHQQQQQHQRRGPQVAAVQQQEQAQPLESLRQMGQRLASGLQQQYVAATNALVDQQPQQQPRPQHGRRGSSSAGGRKSAQEDKCSIM